MQLEEYKQELSRKGIAFQAPEPMSRHTSFCIGGAADVFVSIRSIDELAFSLTSAKALEIPVLILGKGSNLLVSDEGIAGAVLSLAGLDRITIEGCEITCGAGAPLSRLCVAAKDAGLAGLAFAYGIPGSVGGGLFMNAGAYGGCMADTVVSAEVMDDHGDLRTVPAQALGLGYRTSVFRTGGGVITAVRFRLRPGDPAAIACEMREFTRRRREKQPLEYPSAGSTFKRPEGHFAGALIEQSGLKGAAVGGAQVSEKHAGFVVNCAGATAREVRQLVRLVCDTVYKDSGILLEPEIITVGRNSSWNC